MKYEIKKEMMKQIQEITMTDYEDKNGLIPVETIESIMEDLIYEYHEQQGRIEELEQQIKDMQDPDYGKPDPYDEYRDYNY